MKGLYNIQGPKYRTYDWVYWYFDENNQYQEEVFTETDGGYFPKKYADMVRNDDYMSAKPISKDYDVMKKHYMTTHELLHGKL